MGDCIWIPHSAIELQMKIIVISHCSIGGHRGRAATLSVVKENFRWASMKDDVDEFLRQCIHCIITRTGEIIPRPMGAALHGTRPNEVLHVDYLYMGIGYDGLKYLLVIRDDLSSYIWIRATDSCTGEFAALVLSQWVAAFGNWQWLVTDQGSHFMNKLHTEMVTKFRTRKHFTTAYTPWANGTVERVNREVLRGCKALLSEWHLAPQDWPDVVDCVQSVVNHAPLQRLGTRSPGVYRTPLEVFKALKPTRPLLCALPISKHPEAETESEVRARQVIVIDRVQAALNDMHKDVSERCDSARARQILKHNAKTNVLPANFAVGDMVLVRRAQKKGHKLQFVWKGPRRISRVKSKWVFEVEDLIEKKLETVHARRLMWYRADREDSEISPELLEYATHSETIYQDAEKLLDIRREDGLEVHVEWQGLPDRVDRTWEPVAQLIVDIPGMLKEYLETPGKDDLKAEALKLLINTSSNASA